MSLFNDGTEVTCLTLEGACLCYTVESFIWNKVGIPAKFSSKVIPYDRYSIVAAIYSGEQDSRTRWGLFYIMVFGCVFRMRWFHTGDLTVIASSMLQTLPITPPLLPIPTPRALQKAPVYLAPTMLIASLIIASVKHSQEIEVLGNISTQSLVALSRKSNWLFLKSKLHDNC
jgi:hypothetical protein